MRSTARLAALSAVLLLGLRCIAPVSLDDAPCPCGAGASCCETLQACLPAGASCPANYPASSRASCSNDGECGRTEACHAWRTADGAPVGGPRKCRRRCDPKLDCAAGERCELAPHDGLPLQQFATIALCLDDSAAGDGGPDDGGPGDGQTNDGAPDDCSRWSCRDCPADRVGRAFCDGTDVYGCLVSTHPQCGLKCQKVLLQHCDSCSEAAGAVDCTVNNFVPDDPCLTLRCSDCVEGKLSTCADGNVETCLRAPFDGPTCSEVCQPSVLQTCATGCADGPTEARCTN